MASPPAIASARLVVGLEIHVELATRSKMFSATANVAHPDHYDAPPNTLVDPVVAALPGTLPAMNRGAVELAMTVGVALGCRIASVSQWDRKNYFYPDLPKGYQISQYELPLCFDGAFEIPVADGSMKSIGIIRAHLEEDTGKLGHELPGGGAYDGSLVDLNRAGTPLLEIVTEPDLASADEAVTFAQELRTLCRWLGVTEGIMQRGHMRFEPNVNVIIRTDDGHEYATPVVEIKNLNSFKALRGAIEHEHERQVEQWKSDGLVMGPRAKSTRGWDDTKLVTFLQRSKEDAPDYRYFPDPDLVPVEIADEWRERVTASVGELPLACRRRFVRDDRLTEADAAALTDERRTCTFYESCVAAIHAEMGTAVPTLHAAHEAAKWVLNAAARRANERGCAVDELGITPRQLAQIIVLRDDGAIGSSAADRLFDLLCETDDDAGVAAGEHGLLQVSDASQLDAWIVEAIDAQPQAAADFMAGKDAAMGRLVGEVMKRSAGQADATAVQERLRARLR
jgi:aspartyl-tRNA(Asn)/glutamyl-tRNA(Gln) amidotransferase subunit B